MYLGIDTSEKNLIRLRLFGDEETHAWSYHGNNRDLLIAIDEFLREHGSTPDDLEGMVVVVGLGSFTSTRVACVVANVFAYVKGVRLCAVTRDVYEMIPTAAACKQYMSKGGRYISAQYSGLPHITPSRMSVAHSSQRLLWEEKNRRED